MEKKIFYVDLLFGPLVKEAASKMIDKVYGNINTFRKSILYIHYFFSFFIYIDLNKR